METGTAKGRLRAKTAQAMRMFLLLGAAVAMLLGCARIPSVINLYDLSGYNLMQCSTISSTQRRQSQGSLRCVAPDGEIFQGQWMNIPVTKGNEPGADSYMSSLPSLTGSPLSARWGWAAGFGVDMDNINGNYGILLLYGNRGTVIDGVFLFRVNASGILGAATDNKGHRYKIMG